MLQTTTTIFIKVLAVVLALSALAVEPVSAATATSAVYVEKSAYKNVVIEIRDNVPVENCQTILHNVEVCMQNALKTDWCERLWSPGVGDVLHFALCH